jgi:ADP-ribose pyrophosphatase YjhB (NUDIX family)
LTFHASPAGAPAAGRARRFDLAALQAAFGAPAVAAPDQPASPDHATAAAIATIPPAMAAPAGSDDALDLAPGPPTPAAVLAAFVMGARPGVLLTKRTAHLSAHAGQIAFPGGRIDAADASAEAASLREAQEEIGLDPARINVLGRLGDYLTGTGYRITPVIAALPAGRDLDDLAARGGGGVHARSRRAARSGGAAAAAGALPRPVARILGLAASRPLYLGRDGGDPGADRPTASHPALNEPPLTVRR